MIIENKSSDEKLQYVIYNMLFEDLTVEEIFPFDQRRVIEQAKFTYSSLGKAFEKETKTTEDQERKQVDAFKVLKPEEDHQDLKSNEGLFPKDMRSIEIKNEIDEIKTFKDKIV